MLSAKIEESKLSKFKTDFRHFLFPKGQIHQDLSVYFHGYATVLLTQYLRQN